MSGEASPVVTVLSGEAPVAPLGETGITPLVSRETTAVDPAVVVAPVTAAVDPAIAAAAATLAAAEKAVTEAKTPEEKTAAEAALAALKPADPAKEAADKAAAEKVVADALAAAEKAVADAKTPEEKAAAEKALADLKKANDKPGAPEKYEAFKLPDGLTVDPAQLEAFEPLARELNLSQSQAQKLIDFEAGRVKAAAEAQHTAWNKLLEDRLTEAKADKEIGGTLFGESVAHAKKFIASFGSPKLQAYLDVSDAGSHVELIRAFAKAGKAIGEDTLVLGGKNTNTTPLPLEDRIFGAKKA